jgi:hypothetical protein
MKITLDALRIERKTNTDNTYFIKDKDPEEIQLFISDRGVIVKIGYTEWVVDAAEIEEALKIICVKQENYTVKVIESSPKVKKV